MTESEFGPLFDDFVFEPNDWDIAMAIGLAVQPDEDRAALDELADAMLVWAEGPELEELTDRTVDRLWSDDLADGIREGFDRVGAMGDEWATACEAARAEFDRRAGRSAVSRSVVQELAMQLGHLDVPFLFCLCCLDEAVAQVEPDLRREVALAAAVIARRNAQVAENEVRAALAHVGKGAVAELARDDRRAAVRARLGRVGRLGRESIPALAAELSAIGAEPLPANPEDDDAWGAVCTALLADVARPELN